MACLVNPIQIVNKPEKGYCQCGCQQRTKVAKKTRSKNGHVKGEPIPYINGHNRKKQIRYIVEFRGYRTPCWTWQLGKSIWGYGLEAKGHSQTAAHRAAYLRNKGSIPERKHLDHLCRNRDCVNPDHLEPVDHEVNIQRGRLAKLNPYSVFQIKLLAEKRTISRCDIADMFGVSPATVFAILRGSIWKNVPGASI